MITPQEHLIDTLMTVAHYLPAWLANRLYDLMDWLGDRDG